MSEPDLPLAVIQLMKGVVYRDTHEHAWRHLLQLQPQVRAYVAVLGLQVVVDEAEGYAFCRQRPPDEARDEDADPLPRLIPRRPLSFLLLLSNVMRDSEHTRGLTINDNRRRVYRGKPDRAVARDIPRLETLCPAV